MARVYDEKGFILRFELTRCVRPHRLGIEAFEDRISVKVLYLGAADGDLCPRELPEKRRSENGLYPNDRWCVRFLESPWRGEPFPGNAMIGIFRDEEHSLWLSYWSQVGLKDKNLTERGILFRFFVPEIVAEKQGTMKVFLDDCLMRTAVLGEAGEQQILITPEELYAHTASLERYLLSAHRIQKKLLTEFVRAADKYHIRYYLFCGGLIGALRHGGPVPWDDDLDIALPREDYQRLLEIAKKEWPAGLREAAGGEKSAGQDRFALLTYESYGKNCFFDYMTRLICISDREPEADTFGKLSQADRTLDGCLALDLYLLDNAPDSVLLHRIQAGLLRFLYALSIGHRGNYNFEGHPDSRRSELLAGKALYEVGKRIPIGLLNRIYAWVIRWGGETQKRGKKSSALRALWGKTDEHGRREMVYFQANGYHRCFGERLPVSWFGEGRRISFDGINVRIPKEAEKLLRLIYNEYDQLPFPPFRVPKQRKKIM